MKKNLFVLLFAVGLLSSCDNISYDIMNESNLEKKTDENLGGTQTRSNSTMQDYSMKNLKSLAGYQVRVSLNTTATSDIFLTKKPQSSGSAPWLKAMRGPDNGDVEEQYWMLIQTGYSYDGKPAFGIKSVTCDKILSKNDKGSSNGQTTVRFPIGNNVYNLYDKRDLWLFEYSESARSYLLINAETPSMCLVRKSGADASNPLQLISKNDIRYHDAYWNVSSVETFELLNIKYFSTSNLVIENISDIDVLFDNTSDKPFDYENTYAHSVENEAASSWSMEFTINQGVEISSPSFSKDGGGVKVSVSTTNKWLSGGSSKTTENVSFSVKVKQTIPSKDILKMEFQAVKYKGAVVYEALVRGSKGEATIYGKWEGAVHQDIRIILSDRSSSTPVEDNKIVTRYTRW